MKSLLIERIKQKIEFFQFSRRQQLAFLEDLSTLIEDGVAANQAVQTIATVAEGPTQQVCNSVLKNISEGKPIAEGLENWFPQPIVEIIRAGEEGGTLAENMTAAARTLSRQTQGMGSLINSLVYPFIVIMLGLGVAVFVRHSVFQNFAAIKPVSGWPTNGQLLYNIADFAQSWWWLIIIFAVAIVIAFAKCLQEVTGDIRIYLDKLPLFSLYREVTAARFMETLGLLLSNGIVLKRALSILRNKSSHYLAWHVYMMEFRLSGGRENIAEVLDTGLLNAGDIMRLRVIAKGRGFEHALSRLGLLSAERTAKKIDLTGKILGAVFLTMGAAWAAFMIFAIYNVGSYIAS